MQYKYFYRRRHHYSGRCLPRAKYARLIPQNPPQKIISAEILWSESLGGLLLSVCLMYRQKTKTFNERPVFLGKPFYDSTPGTARRETAWCRDRSFPVFLPLYCNFFTVKLVFLEKLCIFACKIKNRNTLKQEDMLLTLTTQTGHQTDCRHAFVAGLEHVILPPPYML